MKTGSPFTVLHLISTNEVYGAAKVILTLGKGLVQKGHRVIIGNLVNPESKSSALVGETERAGMRAQEFPCQKRLDRTTLAKLKEFITLNHVDIVHTHGYKTNYYALKAESTVKLVATCHNWTSNTIKMKLYELFDYHILKSFDRVVGVSQEIYRKLQREGILDRNLKLIYNGVEVITESDSSFAAGFKKKYGVTETRLSIGTVGRLSPEKGQMYLVRGFAALVEKYKDIVLFMVGDGPDRQKLEKEVRRLDLERQVIFTGYQPDAQKMIANFDIFVLPSLKEGVPMVLLEAMLARKIIVATAVGEVPAILGERGIVCQSGDAQDIKNALKKALSLSDGEASCLGEDAHARVVEKYSAEKMVTSYLDVYEELHNELS